MTIDGLGGPEPEEAKATYGSPASWGSRDVPREQSSSVDGGGISRKGMLAGLAATMGAGVAGTVTAGRAGAATSSGTGAVNVRSTGAIGDGASDDTQAVRAALVAADGGETYFPPGTYVLDALLVDRGSLLRLDPAATLLAMPNSPNGVMIQLNGPELIIEGGVIDGNKDSQSGRPVIIAGDLQSGKSVRITRVHFTGTVKAALYLSNFGGTAVVEGCLFTNQAEHNGVSNDGVTMLLNVTSGQPGVKGHLRFSNNRAIGTVTPRTAGSNPGGVFISPATTADPETGNLSTFEASGNHFWGYGQNLAGNTISALHLYRSTLGARITGNYFEESSISAVTAKSVTDFVCTNNVFVGGATSPQNVASQGVIAYVPGYNAGSQPQPRAVIAGNIIDRPGGQSTTLRQTGISVHGTSTSRGTDVVVANNVVRGGGIGIHALYMSDLAVTGNTVKSDGVGIQAYYVDNLSLTGNVVRSGIGGAAGSQGGVVIAYVTGGAFVADNIIETRNGHGLLALLGMSTARVTVQGNRFEHASTGYYAAVMRGMTSLKVSGNDISATVGAALDVRADAAGNRVGRLTYDLTNTVTSGAVTFVWADIVQAGGQLRASNSPLGAVTPAEVGTTYQQTDGSADSLQWVALGSTKNSWARVLRATVNGPAAANGLLAYTYDPISATASQVPAPSGVMHLAKLGLSSGAPVAKVVFTVVKAGTGLVTGQCFVGVYDSVGMMLAKSADLATTLGSVGTKTIALTAPTPPLSPGVDIFVGLLWNGTSGPELRGVAGGLANIGLTAPGELRFATAGSGLTALPGTRPRPAATNSAPWMGLA